MSKFGDRLREIRKGAGLSLATVASHLRVSVSYLSNVETGKKQPLSLHHIIRFSELLNSHEVTSDLIKHRNASKEFYCFKSELLSVDFCVMLDTLLRNLQDPLTQHKTQKHPIVKRFTEVLNVIYMGGK